MWTANDECFKLLFTGHPDAYGSEQGGCIKQPPSQLIFEGHLYGKKPIGIYCTMPGNLVQWACSDIDVDDYAQAHNVASALRHMGFNPYVEVSRSKGYHVWLFFSEPVSAYDARKVMLLAHKAANVQVREVNPKQVELNERKPYGNYVRLPYPHLEESTPRRKVWRAPFKPYPFEEFVWSAYDSCASPNQVKEWANRYVEPAKVRSDVVPSTRPDQGSMRPLTRHVFNNGPGEGYDRSTTLVRLARLMREDGIPAGEALGLLLDADARWGKFSERVDGREQLEKILATYYE